MPSSNSARPSNNVESTPSPDSQLHQASQATPTTTDHEAAETTAAQPQPPIKMHQSRNGPHYQRPGTPPCTNSNDPYSCNNPEAHHPWEDQLMQEWSDTQPDLFEATRRTALRQHDERDDPTNSRVLGTDSPPTPYNGPQPTLGRPRHVRQGGQGDLFSVGIVGRWAPLTHVHWLFLVVP